MKTPNAFGNANSGEDQSHWLDFSFSFKQWFFYAEPGYEADLRRVEDNLNIPVNFTAAAEGAKSLESSKCLCAILFGLLQHRPLKLLKQVPDSNGLEVWKHLCGLFTPRTKSMALGLLSALMSHPPFSHERTIHEQIQGLDRIADEY